MLFGHIRRPVSFLVKAEAFTPVLAPILGAAAARSRWCATPSIRPPMRRVRFGCCAAAAPSASIPEGRRGDGRVCTTRPGAAYLALRSGAAVLPVAAHGTADLTAPAQPAPPDGAPHDRCGHPSAALAGRRPLNRRVVATFAEQLRVMLAGLVVATEPRARAVERMAS